MVFDELDVNELDGEVGLLMNAFFTTSEPSKASGRAYIERLKSRVDDRDTPASKQSAMAELAAIREWGVIPSKDRFAMLSKIQQPTLVELHFASLTAISCTVGSRSLPISATTNGADHLPAACVFRSMWCVRFGPWFRAASRSAHALPVATGWMAASRPTMP
jgi:hypothetical protein